ncbi:hypothetical protein BDR07DRAFT_1393120 [Suillus spraguei]|nr:hypothetical protein BDR07DRAFT_1393120 [Suillus spraguei]
MAAAPSASAEKQQRRDHAQTESGTWPRHHQPSAKKQQRRDHAHTESGTWPWHHQRRLRSNKDEITHSLRAGHGRGTISITHQLRAGHGRGTISVR